jgi:hypothetical protein
VPATTAVDDFLQLRRQGHPSRTPNRFLTTPRPGRSDHARHLLRATTHSPVTWPRTCVALYRAARRPTVSLDPATTSARALALPAKARRSLRGWRRARVGDGGVSDVIRRRDRRFGMRFAPKFQASGTPTTATSDLAERLASQTGAVPGYRPGRGGPTNAPPSRGGSTAAVLWHSLDR